MKSLIKLLISMCIFLSLSTGQIDTASVVDLFPLQIGNRWQFAVYELDTGTVFTGYRYYYIDTDSLMVNNKKYFNIQGFSNTLGCWLRVDSSQLKVMQYFPFTNSSDTTCPDSEFVLFNLSPVDATEYYVNCPGMSVQHENVLINTPFFNEMKLKSYYFYDYLIGYRTDLLEGIGILYHMYAELSGEMFELVAAEINGIQYGEFLDVEETKSQPIKLSLYQNYPNPFNPVTTIEYELPQRSDVQITIYDLLGREVTSLLSGTQEAGPQAVKWNASNVSSGIYFYQIRAGEFVQTRKMVLLK